MIETELRKQIVRIMWFVGLWGAGVLSVLCVGYILRLLIP
jgi:hypothetical protein